MADVSDGQTVYWEECGNPDGAPVVVLHGGPGSGCSPAHRRWFDPDVHRVLLFDQRGSGRSTPHASDPGVDLSANTTAHLIRDIETLRTRRGIDAWAVVGISWGTTLALAYAQSHAERVSGMVLASVGLTSRAEVEWITRAMGRVFPLQWERFVAAVPEADRGGNLAAAYDLLLRNADPGVQEDAAAAWCAWEDTHVATYPGHRHDTRYDDPRFRMGFARLVTHYWANAGFLDDGALLAAMPTIAHIPAVLVHGARDISSPPDIPVELAKRWPAAQLVLVDDAGHAGDAWTDAVLAATGTLAPGRTHDRRRG
jgi:proline iminopeptidase